MRSKTTLWVVLGLASMAVAKDPKPYQTGKLLQMDSVTCGTAEKDASKNERTYLKSANSVRYLSHTSRMNEP